MRYLVVRNRCNCHPETCCCLAYNVLEPNGQVYIRTDDLAKAEKIQTALNHLESHYGKASSLKS